MTTQLGDAPAGAGRAERVGRPTSRFLTRAFAGTAPRIGAGLAIVVIGLAVFGPFLAPHDPAEILTRPYAPRGDGLVIGGDFLGRDAFSRFLWGGRALLVMAVVSMVFVYLLGVTIGLLTAFKRGRFDVFVMSALDVALAFPPLIFVLMLLASVGSHLWVVVVAIVVIFAPRVARIVRGAALDVVTREFVEAAVARGERPRSILSREVLPNLWPPLLADFGVRATWIVILLASLGFLGFGQQPPSADWGSLISENRSGLLVQPLPVLVPLATLASLTVGINLVADGIVRALGRSDQRRVPAVAPEA